MDGNEDVNEDVNVNANMMDKNVDVGGRKIENVDANGRADASGGGSGGGRRTQVGRKT